LQGSATNQEVVNRYRIRLTLEAVADLKRLQDFMIECDLAAALIDRVLHLCHLINTHGNSHRMREHTELYRTLQPRADAAETDTRSRQSSTAGH
jgi:hypothetical protein